MKVRVYVDTSSGSARCAGLDIRGFDGELGDEKYPPRRRRGQVDLGEVTTTFLRDLSVPRLLAEACQNVKLLADSLPDPDAESVAGVKATLEHRGKRYPLDHYREVARVYSEAMPDRPTKAVKEHFGLTSAAASKQVARCREMGLLGPARRGQAGGAGRVKR